VPDFSQALAIFAVVLTVAALVSGLVERSPLTFPLIFVGLGIALGERGLGIITIGPDNPILGVISTLTLSLILFLEALKLQVRELGRGWSVPFLVLGPGTILVIVLGSIPFVLFLKFGWIPALIGGAILASTDLVVLRAIFRNERIPLPIRQILTLEAGMNDIIILPVILLLIAVVQGQVGNLSSWPVFLTRLLLLGPLIGLATGVMGAWLLKRVDDLIGVRLEYQALFGLGLAFAAYSASTTAGGHGLLAVFACGIAVMLTNKKMCQCFLEYGEVTSEMAMLITFAVFGAVLSTIVASNITSVPMLPIVGLALWSIFLVRPLVMGVLLIRANISWEAHALISWLGPRGLDSILLALLMVQAGLPNGEVFLAAVGVAAIASAAIHGASAAPIGAWYARKVEQEALAEERAATAAGLFKGKRGAIPRISSDDLRGLLAQLTPPIVLDVRPRIVYERDRASIPGSIRILSDHIIRQYAKQYPERTFVVYSTHKDGGAGNHAVGILHSMGIEAVILDGGLDSWRSKYVVQSSPSAMD
jgi:NhaP-type Na+/H+ or K+/H+ antiporter